MVEEYENHRNYQKYIKTLNHIYKDTPALWERDFTWEGFSWISNDDYRQSIIVFRRFDASGNEMIVVCNFVPVARTSYCFGVPYEGEYTEVFNCTSPDGSPCTNGTVHSKPVAMHGLEHSICVDIPAYGCMYFTVKKDKPKRKRTAKTSDKTKTAAKKTASKTSAKTETKKTASKASAKSSAKKAAEKKPAAEKTASKTAKSTTKKKSAAKKADE